MLKNKAQLLIVLAVINIILAIFVGVLMANGIYAGGLILTVVVVTIIIVIVSKSGDM